MFRFPGQKVKPPRLDWSERGGRGGVWVRAYIYAAHERGEPEKVGEKFRRSCCHAHGRSSFLLTTTVGVDFFCSFFFLLPSLGTCAITGLPPGRWQRASDQQTARRAGEEEGVNPDPEGRFQMTDARARAAASVSVVALLRLRCYFGCLV